MVVYRIVKKNYIEDISGEGSRLYGGRWHYPGYRILYTSESLALAILEYITKVGVAKDELKNIHIAYIDIDDEVTLANVKAEDLPENWNSYPAPEELKGIGTDWLITAKSLILRVPAVSVPDSYNILINPMHHEFNKVALAKVTEYHPDTRLQGN